MLTVAEALDAILLETRQLSTVSVNFEHASGKILLENVCSDIDIPPFDKALMDGYALRSADFLGGLREFRVVEEILAGGVPQRSIGPGEAAQIMTGAPLPAGADAVVIVEQARLLSDGESIPPVVQVESRTVVAEQNLLRRGCVSTVGRIVVSAGTLLRAQEIGALAEAGCSTPVISSVPEISILATGDELVPPGEPLRPGQIRNSNEPMLASQMRSAGGIPRTLGIAPDQPEPLLRLIRQGLESDVLLLSGGVSAGKRDLVPSQLVAAGVRQVFHKIQMKPGKPLWFGVYEPLGSSANQRRCLVFGLPGNPVSSMVCADLFVRPALRKMLGITPARVPSVGARLVHPFHSRSDRPTYHPARLSVLGTELQVEIVDWIGSSDLRSTVAANGTVFLPSGEKQYVPGEELAFHSWEEVSIFTPRQPV